MEHYLFSQRIRSIAFGLLYKLKLKLGLLDIMSKDMVGMLTGIMNRGVADEGLSNFPLTKKNVMFFLYWKTTEFCLTIKY